ncbi:hydrogenase maturation factor [Burkholderia sp. IMCC1007]|uniref:hydrogenase maturation factor n=1 Tax=Burkholderia sp. IMCC1007 TaxID=3004104 RepID=UPI0022B35967|nr:hydrogenase maturation factor [Burkholderia sp. IMCC1007]
MNSAYSYRGYTIDVRCEFRVDVPADYAPPDPLQFGFVAIVQVRAAGVAPRLLAPIRLGDDGGRLFGNTRNALHAGRAAGEIIVDDLLVGSGSAEGRAHS